MDWQDILADGYNRIGDFMEHTLSGLSKIELDWQPREDCNSIGWLCWHLTRQQDAQIASLMGEEQLYIKDGWHSKFNREADDRDMGFGHTPEQVTAFRSPSAQALTDYQKAVTERSKAYFKTLSGTDLDRELDEPMFQPLPTVGVRLVSILDDAVIHIGQAAYVRGLRQGRGWQRY